MSFVLNVLRMVLQLVFLFILAPLAVVGAVFGVLYAGVMLGFYYAQKLLKKLYQ